jgi:hypothetical protein
MANTMTLIASSTVGSGGASSIDFTSIPSTYTDLQIFFSTRDNGGGPYNNLYVTFNGSSSGYSDRIIYGTGSAAASTSNSGAAQIAFAYSDQAGATANTFSNGIIYIPNYAGSNNKSVSLDSVTENNATQSFAALAAGLWANSAAINRVTLTAAGQTLVQYSTAYLYGINNA